MIKLHFFFFAVVNFHKYFGSSKETDSLNSRVQLPIRARTGIRMELCNWKDISCFEGVRSVKVRKCPMPNSIKIGRKNAEYGDKKHVPFFIARWSNSSISCLLTAYSNLDSWSWKMSSIGCPETSVMNYHYLLRNSTEERNFCLLRAENWNHKICPARGEVKWRLLKKGTENWFFNTLVGKTTGKQIWLSCCIKNSEIKRINNLRSFYGTKMK